MRSLSFAVAVTLCNAAVFPLASPAADPEAVIALPGKSLRQPPRKSLPGRDCLTCSGPPAAAPCFHSHRGFLYYGTYPWDDDPVNGFDDCPGGRCGYVGAMLSLHWIHKHQAKAAKHDRCRHQALGCPSGNATPHYFPGAETPWYPLQVEGQSR